MTTMTTAPRAPLTHDESRGLAGRTMFLIAATSGAFVAGAYAGRDAAGGWGIVWLLASFAVLLGMGSAVHRSPGIGISLLVAFGVLLGLASSATLSSYLDADPQAVWQAGAATALFMVGLGSAGYATERDLSGLARGLLWALVGLIAFGIVLIFVHVPGGALVYAIFGLVIFAGLTLWDFQRLRQIDDQREAPLLAASIFLDALNVFQFFLYVFSNE